MCVCVFVMDMMCRVRVFVMGRMCACVRVCVCDMGVTLAVARCYLSLNARLLFLV